MASKKIAKQASVFIKVSTAYVAAPARDAGLFEGPSEPVQNNAIAYAGAAALASTQPYAVRHNYPSS